MSIPRLVNSSSRIGFTTFSQVPGGTVVSTITRQFGRIRSPKVRIPSRKAKRSQYPFSASPNDGLVASN